MLKFADLASESIDVTIGEKPYVFPLLKRGQIGKLLKKWAAQDRAVLLTQCKEAGVSPDSLLQALRQMDTNAKLLSYFIGCLADSARATEALEESLGAPAKALELHPKVAIDLATCVAGYQELVETEEAPNPKA